MVGVIDPGWYGMLCSHLLLNSSAPTQIAEAFSAAKVTQLCFSANEYVDFCPKMLISLSFLLISSPKPILMMRILLLIMFTLSLHYLSFGQTDTLPPADPAPTFNYHKDFKRIIDSSQDNGSSLYYHRLLKRFLDNDSSLTKYETLALMVGFTENPHYHPLEDMEKEQEIFEHNKNEEFQTAINKSRSYLPTHPLSLLVLREISYAYQQLSKDYARNFVMDTAILFQDSGKYFMDLNDKIMEAMIFSGKGRTPETPIFSMGLADGEYFIFNVGYKIESDGVKESKDTEWNKEGDFVEVITALTDNINAKKFYFVIQHAKKKIDDDKANELAAQKAKKTKKKEPKKDSKDKKPEKKTKGKKPSPPPPVLIDNDKNDTIPAVNQQTDTLPASLRP